VEALRVAAEQANQVMRDEVNAFLEMATEKKIITEQVNGEIADLNETFRANQIEAARIDYENQTALMEETLFGQLELERRNLEEKEKAELEHAQRIGANTTLIEQKYSNAKKKIAQAERDAKLGLAADFANNVATIAGENTAVGKAAAVASTAISTYQAATSSYASLAGIPIVGPALGAVAAASAVVSGLANIKKILSVKSGLPGEGSVSGSGIGGSATPPAVATVNPEIGAGIVSRDTISTVQQETAPATTPVLVTDNVTAKQNEQSAQQITAIL